MWCKRYFEQEFPNTQCRLFSTQNLLFQFLDTLPSDALQSSRCWLPFSIELHSEEEVSQRFSFAGIYGGDGGEREGNTPSIFQSRKRGCSKEEKGSETYSLLSGTSQTFRSKRPRREAFCLLYGENALSCQTRFFLACTIEGVKGMIAKMASEGELHLYEIIRETAPCHLYFDVECEGNLNITVPCVSVDELDEEEGEVQESPPKLSFDTHRRMMLPSSCAIPQVAPNSSPQTPTTSFQKESRKTGRETFTVSQYYQYIKNVPATEYPPACCPASCPCLAPSTGQTTDLLLRSLYCFIQEHYSQLFHGVLYNPPLTPYPSVGDAGEMHPFANTVKDAVEPAKNFRKTGKKDASPSSVDAPLLFGSEKRENENERLLPSHYRCWKQIIVMESKNILEKDGAANDDSSGTSSNKFSQHYVLQLHSNRVWENNRVVGLFVKHFVEYLQEKIASISPTSPSLEHCSTALSLHSALFFHSGIKMWSVRLSHDAVSPPILYEHANEANAKTSRRADESLASYTMLPPSPVMTLPFLVRKCFIDTAVYSKNRMMRCLYSAKLHKPFVLLVEQEIRCGRRVVHRMPTSSVCWNDGFTLASSPLGLHHGRLGRMASSSVRRDDKDENDENEMVVLRKLGTLLNSLISVSITHVPSASSLASNDGEEEEGSIISFQALTREEGHGAPIQTTEDLNGSIQKKWKKRIFLSLPSTSTPHRSECSSLATPPLVWTRADANGGVDRTGLEEPPASLLTAIQQQYSTLSGKPCSLAAKPRRMGPFLLYTVQGSRYCQNVKREHKSNNVYIVVDMVKRVWAQKCFDPDCTRFRGPLIFF